MKNVLVVLMVASFGLFGFSQEEELSIKKLDKISKSFVVLKGKETLKLNEYGQISENVHGSVGITVTCEIDGDGLEIVKTNFEYKDKSKSNMSGGDAGYKTFYIKAIKKGNYKVIVKKYFRGDPMSEYEFKVEVL